MLSRFSCVRLCDPIDSSPPGSPVPGNPQKFPDTPGSLEGAGGHLPTCQPHETAELKRGAGQGTPTLTHGQGSASSGADPRSAPAGPWLWVGLLWARRGWQPAGHLQAYTLSWTAAVEGPSWARFWEAGGAGSTRSLSTWRTMALADSDDRTGPELRSLRKPHSFEGQSAHQWHRLHWAQPHRAPLSSITSSEPSSGYPPQSLHVIRFKWLVFHKTHETHKETRVRTAPPCSAERWELWPEESGKKKKCESSKLERKKRKWSYVIRQRNDLIIGRYKDPLKSRKD